MKQKIFYVAVTFGSVFSPTIVEQFNNQADAESYATLMCRTKKARYIVLDQVSEWTALEEQENTPTNY